MASQESRVPDSCSTWLIHFFTSRVPLRTGSLEMTLESKHFSAMRSTMGG